MKPILVGAIALLPILSASVWAKQGQIAPMPRLDPMRVVLVRSDAPDCTPNCPEWISAEGSIVRDTPAEFRQVLRRLGKRQVPILLHSPGGLTDQAMEIGRLLRARHADVAVAKTDFSSCLPKDETCRKDRSFTGFRGSPNSNRAICASACAYLLAGGTRRLVPSWSYVGVHQTTIYQTRMLRQYRVLTRVVDGRRVVIDRRLISETPYSRTVRTPGPDDATYKGVTSYLAEMGISKTLMPLILSTPASEIRWLTEAELRSTMLMTEQLGADALLPRVVASQEQAPPPAAVAGPPGASFALRLGRFEDRFIGVRLDFHRPPGAQGVVMVASVTGNGDAIEASPMSVRLDLPNGRNAVAFRMAGESPTNPLRSTIPLEDFCRLGKDGPFKIGLELPASDGASPGVLTFETRTLLWTSRLLLEACRR